MHNSSAEIHFLEGFGWGNHFQDFETVLAEKPKIVEMKKCTLRPCFSIYIFL